MRRIAAAITTAPAEDDGTAVAAARPTAATRSGPGAAGSSPRTVWSAAPAAEAAGQFIGSAQKAEHGIGAIKRRFDTRFVLAVLRLVVSQNDDRATRVLPRIFLNVCSRIEHSAGNERAAIETFGSKEVV